MNIKKINDCIKELRLFSIIAFIFASYLLGTVIDWMTTKAEPSGLGDGVALTGVIGALVGLCKFTFDFAVKKPKDEE